MQIEAVTAMKIRRHCDGATKKAREASGSKNGSQKLKQIVLKACAYRPVDRYRSAQELYDALAELSDGFMRFIRLLAILIFTIFVAMNGEQSKRWDISSGSKNATGAIFFHIRMRQMHPLAQAISARPKVIMRRCDETTIGKPKSKKTSEHPGWAPVL